MSRCDDQSCQSAGTPRACADDPEDSPGDAEQRSAQIASGDLGFLHWFQAGSAVDGPGVRTVLWMTGCQFRCIYCHNPDTWKVGNGRRAVAAEVVARIARYRAFWRGGEGSGGVTVTGGEPLVQAAFARRILRACKELGIHTALDTNGALGERLSDDDLAHIDLVLLDVKAHAPASHRRLTGRTADATLAFGARLAALGRPVWIRHVLVPGFTDEPGEIDDLARLLVTWSNVRRIEVLPFHQLGKSKWERLGLPYPLRDLEPPSLAAVEGVRRRFRDAGLGVVT
jgi:pyruvate formate lyase activating enzyme